MSLSKKYNYDIDMEVVKELPIQPTKYLYILRPIEGEWYDDKLYINDNSKLKIIAYKEDSLSLMLFLKKYRANPELLPKNIKHDYPLEYISSEDIYKAMQLMLKPMNTFEEFKERLLLATEELPAYLKKWNKKRFGEHFVLVNKKEDCGRGINIYGDTITVVSELYPPRWDEAILFDKENKIFEYWIFPERTNDTPDRSNWKLIIKFYEEKYLYEYLLNREINAVV